MQMLHCLYDRCADMSSTTTKTFSEVEHTEPLVPASSTCLHVAVAHQRLKAVNFLLSNSDDSFVNYKNSQNETAEDMIDSMGPEDKELFQRAFDQGRTMRAQRAATAASSAHVHTSSAATSAPSVVGESEKQDDTLGSTRAITDIALEDERGAAHGSSCTRTQQRESHTAGPTQQHSSD